MQQKKPGAHGRLPNRRFTLPSLLLFCAPSIFAYVFIAVYQTADGLFISRYVGELAISAVNLCYPVIGFYVTIGIMLGSGANARLLFELGAGRKEVADRIFSETIEAAILTGLAAALLSLLFAEPIMYLCGASKGSIVYMRPYYLILNAAAPAIILQPLLGSLIIGEGRGSTAAAVTIIGGILNCVLDYVLMAVVHLGITGAAIATLTGYLIVPAYALSFYLLRRKSIYRPQLTALHPKELLLLCFNGCSDMISNLSDCVSTLAMNHLAFRFYGDPGVSVLTVLSFLRFAVMAVFMGFTQAVEPLFSFFYGSGSLRRRKELFRLSLALNAILSVATALLLFFFKNAAAGIFFSSKPELAELTEHAISLMIPAVLFAGFNILVSGIFTAFSDGRTSARLSALRTLGFMLTSLFVLSALWKERGMWSSWAAAEFLFTGVSLAALVRHRKHYHYY